MLQLNWSTDVFAKPDLCEPDSKQQASQLRYSSVQLDTQGCQWPRCGLVCLRCVKDQQVSSPTATRASSPEQVYTILRGLQLMTQ